MQAAKGEISRPTGEFLFVSLSTSDYGNSKQFFVDSAIEFQYLQNFCAGVFLLQVGRVAFLPVKFSCP